MSINVKKYTKDQMAKMVEDAQEAAKKVTERMGELQSRVGGLEAQARILKAKNAALTERSSQMNGEAITRENVIANLKADLDASKAASKLLNDQGQGYWRAWQASKREVTDLKTTLTDTEAALGRANDDLAFKGTVIDVMRDKRYNAEQRANYAESHPWRNLWAWVKRKVARHE